MLIICNKKIHVLSHHLLVFFFFFFRQWIAHSRKTPFLSRNTFEDAKSSFGRYGILYLSKEMVLSIDTLFTLSINRCTVYYQYPFIRHFYNASMIFEIDARKYSKQVTNTNIDSLEFSSIELIKRCSLAKRKRKQSKNIFYNIFSLFFLNILYIGPVINQDSNAMIALFLV